MLSTLPDVTAKSKNAGRGELMRPWVLIETDDVGLTFENLRRSCGGDRARMILVSALMRRACVKVASWYRTVLNDADEANQFGGQQN